MSHPVESLHWSESPSVTATAGGLIVRARFAILAHDSADAIVVVLAFPPSVQDTPIHFANSDDKVRTVAATIARTIRS